MGQIVEIRDSLVELIEGIPFFWKRLDLCELEFMEE